MRYSDMTDNQLAARAMSSSDRAAFDELYDRLFPWLYTSVVRKVGDRDAASDIVQEAFVRLLSGTYTHQSAASLRSWLVKTATRLVIDRQRKVSGGPKLVPLDSSEDGGSTPQDSSSDPAEFAERADVRSAVRRCKCMLKPREREIIELYYEQELKDPDIASKFKVSKQCIHQIRTKARKKLVECLAQQGVA